MEKWVGWGGELRGRYSRSVQCPVYYRSFPNLKPSIAPTNDRVVLILAKLYSPIPNHRAGVQIAWPESASPSVLW